jgi:hypothetical protein
VAEGCIEVLELGKSSLKNISCLCDYRRRKLGIFLKKFYIEPESLIVGEK